MLLSSAIKLTPLDDAPANARQVQRWFKQALQHADSALFDALHQPNVSRAYTLSEVFPAHDGRPSWFRITSLDADLSALLADRVLPELAERGEIVFDPRGGTSRYAVQDVMAGEESREPFSPPNADIYDPANWVGRTTYGELVTAIMQPPRVPHSPDVALHFRSCTSFRVNAPGGSRSNLPLPVPRYVYQSLVHQWDSLAPAKLPVAVAEFLDYYLWVADYRIWAERVSFGGGSRGMVTGFRGWVRFQMAPRGKLREEIRADWRHFVDVVRLMSAFAFYAGVGVRTTTGLGQTLPLV